MVSTIQIKPAPILQPFVSCYAIREFDTANADMPKPLHAVHEYYLTFFVQGKSCSLTDAYEKVQGQVRNNLCTLFTQSQGCTYWKGRFALFHVQFKSNALFAIFGIPQKLLINTILPIEDILGKDNNLLQEKIEASKNIYEMGEHMNAYLGNLLLKQKHKINTITITSMSNVIFRNRGVVSLDNLSLLANMSLRNFERRFVDEVGISPKLYARITRFYNAVENKMLHINKTWTVIAYENGYFDQAHLIREVKEFSGKTPEQLFEYSPPPKENFLQKVH